MKRASVSVGQCRNLAHRECERDGGATSNNICLEWSVAAAPGQVT